QTRGAGENCRGAARRYTQGDRQSGTAERGTSRGGVHPVPSRNHELSFAELHSTLRPRSVRIPARRDSECLLALLRSCTGDGAGRKVRNCKRGLPPAALEVLRQEL